MIFNQAMLSDLARAIPQRERIPTPVPRSMADGMGLMPPSMPQMPQQMQQPMMQGLGSSSQGLFDSYMSQIFKQKYTPPPIEGIYGQQPGGYMGFFGRQLPAMQQQQQAPAMTPQQLVPWNPSSPYYDDKIYGPGASPGA